jgi:4'-phosphopantetheinyl transferase
MNDNLPACGGIVPIAPDEAHVWKVRLDVDSGKYAELLKTLSPEEQRRAGAFRRAAPRQAFAVARAALRRFLARYLGTAPSEIKLCIDANTKPRLAANQNTLDLRFNVAHSGELALVAVTRDCEVGVDVEKFRPVRHACEIASRYFHPEEIKVIVGSPATNRDDVFLQCWTMKEAVLKAVGTGIANSLEEFVVPCGIDEMATADVKVAGHRSRRVFVQRLDVGDDYLAAVAFLESPRRVQLFDFVV